MFRLLLYLFLLSAPVFAQVRLSGLVVDSLNNPLELANIMAINSNTDAIDAYGVSNSDGKYLLNLKEGTSYFLKVSYVGMQEMQDTITTNRNNFTLTTVLKENNQLKELELVYEMPITINGDTLTYKTDAFTNGNEKKLEDVLEKLPGVEITEDGEVKVEGKVVDKIMVEGKEFFDGDTKLATKNIPADALEKVEVIKNFNEVGMMRNLGGNEDNMALNIKLKDGKKNFWFGDIMAGVGPANRYITHPKLFYYSPKYSVNLITDINNIGEIPFTLNDYFKFSGGFSALNSGTSLNLNDPALRFLMAQNDRAKAIETKFLATNINYNINKNIDLTGFLILSDTKTNQVEKSNTTFFSSQFLDESTSRNVMQRNRLGLAKLTFKYEPNASSYFIYETFGKLSEQNQKNDFQSNIYGGIHERNDLNPKRIQQNINFYKSFSTKDILSLELQHLYNDEDPFYNAILQKSDQFQLANVLHLDSNQNGYQLNQDKQIITNKTDLKARYWYILNKKSNVSVQVGFSESKQRFNSNLYQILDNQTHLGLSNHQGINHVNYAINDSYMGLQYRLKAGIFTIHPGIDFHHYHVVNTQENSRTPLKFNRFLPMLNLRIQFKKSEYLTLSYSTQTQFTDINTLSEGLILNKYNSLYQGNKDLESALNHVYAIGYFNFNQFSFTNIFANLNYVKTKNPISVNAMFLNVNESLDQIESQLNSNFSNENINAEISVEKTIRRIKGQIKGRINYSNYNQFFNSSRQLNHSLSQIYGASIKTNFKKRPNIQVGYEIILDRYNQVNQVSHFYTHKSFIKLKTRIGQSLLLKIDYTHYNFANRNRSLNKYGFLNSSLSYQKKDASFEYKIRTTNLLNNHLINTSQSDVWSTSTTQFYVQPRYVVLSVTYNL